LAQALQDRRQQVIEDDEARADAHAAEPALAVAAHGDERALGFGGDAAAVLDQGAPGLGRERALAQALDEAHADAALELADLEADRRLREVEPPCRRR